MPTRRQTLALLGGGAVVAATAATGFLATRTPTRALAPWGQAGAYDDARLNALSFALLAPTPHNLQPWLAELEGADTVILHRDPERALPHTDPFDRQIMIGMGCFLELLRMAAAEAGAATALTLFPEGPDGPVARVTFTEGGTPDPLFAHVMTRRSCKEPFELTPVPASDVAALAPFAQILTEPAEVEALRRITWEAWKIEAFTPRTWKESVDLLRIGKAEIEASPDGIDLSGLMFDTLGPLGIINRPGLLSPDSTGFRQTMAAYEATMAATPAYAVITTDGNTRAEQIDAGVKWLRLNLATTGLGLALHPVSQALQEYPEMSGPYDEIHARLARPGQTVQMLGRLGYGPEIPRTPRWPLEAKMRTT